MPKTRRELVALIFKIAFLEAMALSLILPSVTSTGEIPSTASTPTGPIQYISTIFKNVTVSTDSFLTTPSWTTSQNETILVVASSQSTFAATKVVSVTDSLGDSFTKVISVIVPQPSSEPTDLEVWIAKDAPLRINSVTVTWNNTNSNGNMIQVQLYQNVASSGQSIGQALNCACIQTSLSITTVKSGVWIMGAISTQSIPNNPSASPCPGQIASESSFFTTRKKGCYSPGGK